VQRWWIVPVRWSGGPRPRFDSDSLFARLLDDQAGHFSIRPVENGRVQRHHTDGSLVLKTILAAILENG
jgi:hypothetical protein